MQMYRNILVALDGSEADEALIGQVSPLALSLGSAVHLLHVVHSHTLDQERILQEQAGKFLERYRSDLQQSGMEVDVRIRSGEPDSEILREIEEHHYDLLAMATHGHTLFGRILFGSVSRALRNKITIPLLLVKGG
jgi:nucleotide-binding universal stress UspA family protein